MRYRSRANAVEGKVAEHPLAKLQSPDERAIADSIPQPDDKIGSNKWTVINNSIHYPDGL